MAIVLTGGRGFPRDLVSKHVYTHSDEAAFRRELQDIARREFAKGRRRLNLSPAQERAVEAMLVAVANEVAHPAIQVMRRAHDDAREREARPGGEAGSGPVEGLDGGLLVAA